MNILFLCNSIVRQGTYFRWHNLAIGLTHLGHAVTVLAFDHGSFRSGERREQRDGVTYRILSGNRGQSWVSQESHPWAALRGCFRGLRGFDVVHVFQPFLTSVLPWLLRRRALAPVVIYDWDDLWAGGLLAGRSRQLMARWAHGITRWFERALPRRADYVTTCSEYLARMARARGARGTKVISNGFWPGAYPDKAAARRQLGLREDCLYVGFMGRTITEAELNWLAASLPVVAGSRVPCRLAVCGLPEQLLTGRVQTHRDSMDHLGILTPEQSRSFAAALDLGLLPLEDVPLNHARFPIKFAEYLAAGTPVLGSAVGPCAELARAWPFVVQSGFGQVFWTESLRATITRLAAGRFPAVDHEAIARRLSWSSAAQTLADLYASFRPDAIGAGNEEVRAARPEGASADFSLRR